MVLSDITNAHSPKVSPGYKSVPPPTAYLCPISFEVMSDPVSTDDGHSYERKNIVQWFRMGHRTSPLTNEPIRDATLRRNHALRSAIAEWDERRPLRDRLRSPVNVQSLPRARALAGAVTDPPVRTVRGLVSQIRGLGDEWAAAPPTRPPARTQTMMCGTYCVVSCACLEWAHGGVLAIMLALPFVCDPDGRRWTFGVLKGCAHADPFPAIARLLACLVAVTMLAHAAALVLAPALALVEREGLRTQLHAREQGLRALRMQLDKLQLESQLRSIAADGCWLW